ncbi:transporter substrate-binding domain-containing protein [Rhodoferax aquaticus]|uniref:Transporter substrate-binding domain-containing protein n=1 Tax=Rhodoferax aquaticus TaxID=2527691 RepID=A0A515EM11_9BURK|nr:transporter substrate-binding domain-containing protein [Rhodoferax aquaticus]QDL53674.1 transporter substrate-binding domain-containing protein [Rhodoferax aquaticus]
MTSTRRFLLAGAALLCTMAGLSAAHAQALPDLKGRTIVAVTENAYPPLNFKDPKTGESVGWEYDAFNEIAKRLNAKVEWKLTSWDTMIEAVRQGQFDVGMDGITIKADRKKQVDFSDPYMVSEQFMMVRANEKRFDNPKAFKANAKLLVGAQGGTTNFFTAVYEVLDGNEKNPRIKLYDTFGLSMQALKAGDVDMVLTDSASSQGYIKAFPNTYKVVGKPMGHEEFGFIFKPKSNLVAPINAAIKQLKADGTFDKLNQKWFVDYKLNQ